MDSGKRSDDLGKKENIEKIQFSEISELFFMEKLWLKRLLTLKKICNISAGLSTRELVLKFTQFGNNRNWKL